MNETIMERLKNETKSAHQQLEKATIPYIKTSTDNEKYAHLLRMFYGYFKPVEDKIHGLINSDILPDIKERRQSAALISDLQFMDEIDGYLTISHEMPVIETIPQALGAMYVLEGSTLGGRFISQMLMKQLNRTATEGITFFSGYGEATMPKWENFTTMMNDYAIKHPLNTNEIVSAANETFSKFGDWVTFFNEKVEVTI